MATASDPDHIVTHLDEVLITGGLSVRSSRPPDYAVEASVLGELVRDLVQDPHRGLQRLCEAVLRLCNADSAGISVLEKGGDDHIRWHAVAGPVAANLGAIMPRDPSPSGTAMDRDTVLLFNEADRFFPDLRSIEPRIFEHLLAPWHADGKPVGTLWAVKHSPEGRFDAEDARLLESLARFAAAAWQTVQALQEAGAGRAELERQGRHWTLERARADAALRVSEDHYRFIAEQAMDYAIFTMDVEHRVTTWPPGAAAVFGWTEAEMVGQPAELTFTPEDRADGIPEQEFALARTTGRAPDVRWHIRKDGRRVFIDGVTRARYGLDGDYAGLLKVGQDVTERRLAEEQRRDAEEETRIELERRVAEATADLRRLSRRLLTLQEEERRFLASELHDEIGQTLTGLGLTLSAVPGPQATRLREAREIVADLTERVRQLSLDLRPAALDEFGLLPALQGLLTRFEHRTGIAVDLRHDGLDRRFPPPVEVAAYRVAQEALTNIARHADTDRAVVQLYADADALTIAIRDQGSGFDLANQASGSGLGGMRERAERLGGALIVDAVPGQGVSVTADLPLQVEEHAQ